MNLLSLPAALVAALSSPASAGAAPSTWQVPMEPDPGYYVEQCLHLRAGETVDYRLESPYPVDFNVHYDVNGDTLYPTRLNHITRHNGRVQARTEGDYCFMWINNERQQTHYRIRLTIDKTT